MTDLSDFFSQPGNILSICSLGVAITAIVISHRSPVRTERIKIINEARRAHFNKIKDGCLHPLLSAIYNVEKVFRLDEMSRYDKNWILQHEKENEPNLTTLRLWISLINSAYGTDFIFENLLYEDLGNHLPGLKVEIERVQKYLDDQYPIYYKKFNELVIKTYYILENTNGIKELTADLNSNVTVALLYLLQFDPMHWPNQYNRASSSGMLDKIKKAIEPSNVDELAASAREISSKCLKMLAELRESIDKIIKFEGELKGMCSYLQ